MIFDERDIDDLEPNDEIVPSSNQMSLDEFMKAKKDNNSTKKGSKSAKNSENEAKKSAKTTKKEEKIDAVKSEKTSKVQKKTELKDEEILVEEKPKRSAKKTRSSKKEIEELEKEAQDVFHTSENEVEEEPAEEETSYDNEGNILKSIKSVMHEAMMPYSEYVILDRALPRVEDGLKPVQRRILYAMSEQGFTYDKPFKKCANTVGYVLGRYHPHGDTSVYNAMVRMAQNFNMRETLIDGHGNFGSVDGDGAAAMRYTEARLSELSNELVRDIDKNTVSWTYTYDDSHLEPEMLPSRFPNILVNGTSGIAVGIATNFAPHNLGEAIDACVAFINNPKITTEELMKIIKGPDFPTGGIILGQEGIKQAYETGKGKIIIRSKVSIENTKNDKINLVITEFPYQVNKAQCLQKISELKENNKDVLSSISEIRDESDRKGTRAVIVLKKDSEPEKILNYLYKYSDLQISFGINMVAIAGGKPKLLSLREILGYYTNYQREVVLKRTEYDLNQAKEKEHILRGLIIAIENIDEIIKIIKKSASVVVAKQTLKQKYNLSEVQAQAIMDMRLSRLTNLEVEKLRQEINDLLKLIDKLEKIVKSEAKQYDVVKTEMLEIKKKYASNRTTEITKELTEITEDDLIKVVKPMYVLVTRKNAIKKIPEKNFNKNSRIITENSNLNEIHSHIILTESDKNLLLFTNMGNVFKLPVDKIIEARFKDRGLFLKDILNSFHPDESVVYLGEERKVLEQKFIIFTKFGMTKIVSGSEFNAFKNSALFIKLKDEDEVVNVQVYDDKLNMMIITEKGMGLYAKTDEIPLQLKAGGGVKAVNLNDDDYVLYAGLIKNEKVLVVTNKGYAKKIELDNFELLPKNRKGVKVYSLDKSDFLIYAGLISDDVELFCLDSKNKAFVVDSQNIPTTNRVNKGSIILKDRKLLTLSAVYDLINL